MRPWFRNVVAVLAISVATIILGFAVLDLAQALLTPSYGFKIATDGATEFIAAIKQIDQRDNPDASGASQMTRIQHIVEEIEKPGKLQSNVVDKAVTCVKSRACTPLDRHIAILASQQAPVEEWVRLANIMLDMHSRREVSDLELQQAIYPRQYISKHGTVDFWRPSVRHVLYRLYFAGGNDDFVFQQVILDLTGVNFLLDYLFYCPRCA